MAVGEVEVVEVVEDEVVDVELVLEEVVLVVLLAVWVKSVLELLNQHGTLSCGTNSSVTTQNMPPKRKSTTQEDTYS